MFIFDALPDDRGYVAARFMPMMPMRRCSSFSSALMPAARRAMLRDDDISLMFMRERDA